MDYFKNTVMNLCDYSTDEQYNWLNTNAHILFGYAKWGQEDIADRLGKPLAAIEMLLNKPSQSYSDKEIINCLYYLAGKDYDHIRLYTGYDLNLIRSTIEG